MSLDAGAVTHRTAKRLTVPVRATPADTAALERGSRHRAPVRGAPSSRQDQEFGPACPAFESPALHERGRICMGCVRARGRREGTKAHKPLYRAKPTEGFEPSTPSLRERIGVSPRVQRRAAQTIKTAANGLVLNGTDDLTSSRLDSIFGSDVSEMCPKRVA